MASPEILFLQQEDVIAAGLLDMEAVLEMVEKAFYLDGQGEIKNPPKTHFDIEVPGKDTLKSSFFSMPVYVGGDVKRAGIKWAAESKANAKSGKLPMGIDLVVLSDPETVLPVAIMDGTLITAMRTSAASGVAAKYLAAAGAKVAGCIGAGVIGRTMIMALKIALPNLEEVRLFDLNREKAATLAAEFAGQIKVIVADSVEGAVVGADVITTMTTSKKPFVKAEWVKPGSLVIQMSAYEIEAGVVKAADKIVVDSWPQIKENEHSVFTQLFKEGALSEEQVISLKDVVAGSQAGRQSDEESIVFGSRGMGCLDILLGDYIYAQAKAKGLGKRLVLWDEAKWL